MKVKIFIVKSGGDDNSVLDSDSLTAMRTLPSQDMHVYHNTLRGQYLMLQGRLHGL